MKIQNVAVSEILDSRGEKTLAVALTSNGIVYSSQIPSGKSKGKREAVSLGFVHAKDVLGDGLMSTLTQREFNSISELDSFLIEYDGTVDKLKVGGDLTLGISIAFARALAGEKGIELWQVLRGEFFKGVLENSVPKIFANMINGGAHAESNLDIQEYQIVGALSGGMESTVAEIKSLYARLGEMLAGKTNGAQMKFGDEQGYAPDFIDNLEPIAILDQLINESAHKESFVIGVDAAASSFRTGDQYRFEGQTMNTDGLHSARKRNF